MTSQVVSINNNNDLLSSPEVPFKISPRVPRALQVPMLGSFGNHELEQQYDSTIFESVQARWKVRTGRSRASFADHTCFVCVHMNSDQKVPYELWLELEPTLSVSLSPSPYLSLPLPLEGILILPHPSLPRISLFPLLEPCPSFPPLPPILPPTPPHPSTLIPTLIFSSNPQSFCTILDSLFQSPTVFFAPFSNARSLFEANPGS